MDWKFFNNLNILVVLILFSIFDVSVMTDHKEEQELELEALTSIYPDEFSCK